MSETAKKIVTALVVLVVFIISLSLVVIGQKNVGAAGLGGMFLGLAGLVALLWFYNRKNK